MHFQFRAVLWKYQGKSAWYFLSLPIPISKEIRSLCGNLEEGWGRLKVKASIGESKWETSIWYDGKLSTYLLPVKAEIRQKERRNESDIMTVELWI